MPHSRFQHVIFLARNPDHHDYLTALLYDPSFSMLEEWGPESPDRLLDQTHRLLADRPELRSLIELHLLTEYLLGAPTMTAWAASWVHARGLAEKFLSGLQVDPKSVARWTAVPTLLSGEEEACCRYFILGLICARNETLCLPPWARGLMNEEALGALRDASLAAMRKVALPVGRSLCAYPLLIPNETTQITGRSLGLPLALGFLALLSGEPTNPRVLATGVVREGGEVDAVERLDGKAACAARESLRGMGRYRAFIFPAACPMPEGRRGRISLLPASTLDEAWMFCSLHAPGRAKDLILFARMLEEPGRFVDGVGGLPVEWLSWACRRGLTDNVLSQILDSAEHVQRLTERLEACTESGNLPAARAIGALVPETTLQGLAIKAPSSVLKWCTLRLALENHAGHVGEASRWSEKADHLIGSHRGFEVHDLVNYYNHRFIDLHNRYRFRPELPPILNKVLGMLERQYDAQIELGSSVNKDLGRLCGSIMQNYAFCGPQYLEKTREYSLLSRLAFGDGRAPDLRADWRRQLNYLTYAEIDAGLFDRAESTLLAYLEMGLWEDVWMQMDRMTRWEHALVARFLSEAGDSEAKRRYLGWAVGKRGWIPRGEHPWQLWLYNVGRMAAELDEAETAGALLEESMGLCLSENFGPTVHVMALLPLSGLQRLGLLPRVDVSALGRRVREAATALNPSFFKGVISEDFERVLEGVWHKPGELFPFNYR